MPSPFPGMDPWMEHPAVWQGFHHQLVSRTVEVLQPQLRSRGYYVDAGERVWLGGPERSVYPDDVIIRRPGTPPKNQGSLAVADEPVLIVRASVELHEGYVEIFAAADHKLVTSIEYVSPANKRPGKGRRLYRRKQRELRGAGIHLLEVDLLRAGSHALDVPESIARALSPFDYLVNIGRRRSHDYEFYPLQLRARLPNVRIPLQVGDDDATLDLQDVFTRSYDIGPYPERLNYNQPPEPPLSPEDDAWADQILRNAGLRQ